MTSKDTPEARDRLRQDAAVSMDELVGRSLWRLVAVRLEGGEPLCLYVEVDAPGCHRMFLDAGLAVWEDWGGITEDDGELVLDDLMVAWGLDGAVVRSAEALAAWDGLRARALGCAGFLLGEQLVALEQGRPSAFDADRHPGIGVG